MKVFKPKDMFPSLGAAVDFLKDNKDEGAICPCCTRVYKVYQRKIHAGMAAALIYFHKRRGTQWAHYSILGDSTEEKVRGSGKGNFSLLAHWDLIEAMPGNDDPAKKTSGFWRVSGIGLEFILSKFNPQETVHLLDNQVIDWSGPSVSISECLGDYFNYAQLMQSNRLGV